LQKGAGSPYRSFVDSKGCPLPVEPAILFEAIRTLLEQTSPAQAASDPRKALNFTKDAGEDNEIEFFPLRTLPVFGPIHLGTMTLGISGIS
jgi:hypothetical protein